MMKYCGRRILCHPAFRLYLSTSAPKPVLGAATASAVTFVNYGASNETFVDDMLTRAFALRHAPLYDERRAVLRAVDANVRGLREVRAYFRRRLDASARGGHAKLFDEKDVDMIADLTDKMVKVGVRVGGCEGRGRGTEGDKMVEVGGGGCEGAGGGVQRVTRW